MKLKGLFDNAVTFVKGISAKTWITVATTAAVATAGTAAGAAIITQGQQGVPGADGPHCGIEYALFCGYIAAFGEKLADSILNEADDFHAIPPVKRWRISGSASPAKLEFPCSRPHHPDRISANRHRFVPCSRAHSAQKVTSA